MNQSVPAKTKLKQWILWILGCGALAFAVYLAHVIYFPIQPYSEQEKRAAHGLDDAPVFSVKIGEQQFNFPRQYVAFVSTRNDRKIVRGRADSIKLSLIWPNIKTDAPITGRLADDQFISVDIGHAPPDDLQQSASQSQQRFFARKWRRITPLKSWGLMEYEMPGTSWNSLSYTPSDESYMTPTGLRLRMVCNRLREEIAEGYDCLVRYPLAPGILFGYKIEWSRLKEWKEIDQLIRARMLSYMGDSP